MKEIKEVDIKLSSHNKLNDIGGSQRLFHLSTDHATSFTDCDSYHQGTDTLYIKILNVSGH